MTNSPVYKIVSLATGAFVAILLVVAFINVTPAHAGVGPGGTASGGGGACPRPAAGNINGCPFTTNGNGWYEIPVDAPNAPQGNGYWNTANPTCKAEGASHVIAYVVLTGERTLRTGWIYRYLSSWEGERPKTGNISTATARARFESLPANERGSYVFGVNLGWFCYNSESWDTSGSSTVSAPNTLPGNQVRWTHTLSQTGRTATRSIYSQTVNSGFVGNGVFNGTHNGTTGALGVGGSRNHTDYGLYTIQQADVGSTLCQQLQWDPTNSNGGRHGRASNACVYIPYNYTLRPEIRNITDGRVVESNDIPFNVPGRITNDGDTRSRPSVNWQITQIEYAPSMALSSIPNRSGGSGSNDSPCRYYTSPQRTFCRGIASANDTNSIPYPGNLAVNGSSNLANKPAGTKICFALSVWPYRQSDSNVWRHSPLVCLIIGKKPKVQVLSGDLMVGRASASNTGNIADVVTSTSENARRYYGSWAEYAIIPSGCVAGMASGSGYVGGAGSDVMSGLSILTFTNPSRNISGQSACPGGVGRYTHTSNAPNVAARFPIQTRAADATPTRPANPAVLRSTTIDFNSTSPTLSGHYQAPAGATNLTINGGTINAGRWVVISAPDSVVTIANNIEYTNSPLTNLNEIPQVVIIARDIIIEDDVERIDAWLVAVGSDVRNSSGAITERRGTINTCGGGSRGITPTSNLTISTCDRRLTVNGPVVANHLVLRRTAGSGPGAATGEPAEVFNLRADAYMWATSYNVASGRLSTVDTKELPPRF